MTDRKNLDRVLIRGVAWTAAVKWLTQIVTWSTTLIVARLLAPSDYGLLGMAAICLNFVTLFSEFGLGTAIITLQDLSDEQMSQLNTFSLLLGVLGFGIAASAAYPLAIFFKAPKVNLVIIVMSVGFVVSSVRTVPYSLLQKELRFKLLAIIEGLQGIIQAISTLVLAFLGFGYWALVLGNLSVSLTSTALTLIWRRQGFAWPRFSVIREALVYSWHIIVGRLSWYVYNDSDFIVAGRVLGEAPLGAYTLAWTLAHAPLEKLTTLVNRVTPSVFAAVQSDFAALRRYLRSITEGLALVIFPATLGMALVAKDFVHLALGSKWFGAVLPLELLAVHALIRSNVILLTPVLNVVGEQRFAMWNNLATLIILPTSFYIASRWGTGGIAGVWVVIYPLVSLPLYWRLFRKIQLVASDYLASLWPAVNGCTLMAVAVVILKRLLGTAPPLYLRFSLEILAGALVYTLALTSMHRDRLRAFFGLVKSFRSPV
jgi:O-antigen/teichoic acid export membrane protein